MHHQLRCQPEHSTPNIFADMIEWMQRHLPGVTPSCRFILTMIREPVLQLVSSESAAGADRFKGCLFGNGERAGNPDLVNVAP
jgi:2-isopropylmalate synthase